MKRLVSFLALVYVVLAGCSERNVYPASPSSPDSCAADSVKGHEHGPKK